MDRIKKVIDYIVRVFLPPENSEDWPLIPWQPFLFLAAWWGALFVVLFGDFSNIPPETADVVSGGVGWVWAGLSLVCPPLALGSLHLIRYRPGKWRYRGFWLRLAADLGQFTALVVYFTHTVAFRDYHIYTMAILMASTFFVGMLVYRDVRFLIKTEFLARELTRGP